MVSHTPPEHHAESAYCSDHIVDANKMVSAGLPSEEEIEAEIRPMSYEGADLTECVSRILDLIRPAFEAKEREIERANELLKGDELLERCVKSAMLLDQQFAEMAELEARALAAEAALRSLRQAILDADIICDDDERAGDRLSRLAAAIRSQGQP